MDYRLQISKKCEKVLEGFDKTLSARILIAISKLSNDPFPPGSKKLAGSAANYRIRVGDYRVIYQVENSILTIYVIRIGHRKDIYR